MIRKSRTRKTDLRRGVTFLFFCLFAGTLIPPAAWPEGMEHPLSSSLTTWQFNYPVEKQAGFLDSHSPESLYLFDGPEDIQLLEIYGRFHPAALPPDEPLFQIHLLESDKNPFSRVVRVPGNPWRKNVFYVRTFFTRPIRIDRVKLSYDPPAASQIGHRVKIVGVAVGRSTEEKSRAKVLDFRPRTLHREIIWDFSDKRRSGWTCPGPEQEFDILGGIYWMKISVEESFMKSPVLQDVRAESFPFMEIRMKADTAVGRGYLYWTTEKDREIDNKKRIGFSIMGSSKFRRYILHLSDSPGWKGRIRELTLFPLDHEGKVGVDSITLFNAPLLEFLGKHTTGAGKDFPFYLAPALWLALLAICRLARREKSAGRWNHRIILYGIPVLLVFAAVFPFNFYPGLKIDFLGIKLIPPAVVLFFFLLFRWIGQKKSSGSHSPRILAIDLSLAAFLVFACLSFLWSGCEKDSMVYLMQYFIPAGIVFFTARALSKEEGMRWRSLLCKTTLGIGIFLSAAGLMSFCLKSDLFYDHFYKIYAENYYQVPVQRISASLIHPTVLGSFLLFPLSVSLSFLLHENKKALKLAGLIGLLLILPALFLTFSRGCWLCAAVVILFFLRRTGWKRILAAAVAILVLLAATLFFSGYTREALRKRLSVLQEESRHRLSGLVTAGRMGFSMPVFGAGPGNYLKLEPVYRAMEVKKEQTNWKTPDNMYLRIFAETGLPGLVLFAFFLLSALKRMAAATRFDPSSAEAGTADAGQKTMGSALRPACIGFSLNLLFYDGLYWFAPMMIFFLFLGTGLSDPSHRLKIDEPKMKSAG